MRLDIDDTERIEAITRDQSDSELWRAMRNSRLTSSRFGEIRNRKETIDSRRLVRDIMGYGKQMKTLPPQICLGQENEQKEVKHYIEDRITTGEEMTATPWGLHLMPNKSYLGTSSDGIVCVVMMKPMLRLRRNNYSIHTALRSVSPSNSTLLNKLTNMEINFTWSYDLMVACTYGMIIIMA